MPDVRVAELILALAGKRDHASTTVGDLLQERATRGIVWFWWCVAAILVCHIWRDLREAPLRLALLALAAFLSQDLILAGISTLVFWPFEHWGHDPGATAVFILWRGLPAVVALFIGRAVTSLSDSRELATALTAGLLFAAGASSRLIPGGLWYWTGLCHIDYSVQGFAVSNALIADVHNWNGATWGPPTVVLSLLAGAVWARFRSRAALQFAR